MSEIPYHYAQRTITNIADWDSSQFGSRIELVQLTAGAFHCRHELVDFGNIQVLRLTINRAIAARGVGPTARCAAVLFDRSRDGHFGAASIQQHELVVLPAQLDFDACVKEGDFGCTVVFLDPARVEAYYRALTGSAWTLSAETSHGVRGSRELADRLALCTHSLLSAAAERAASLEHAGFRDAMRDEILMLVVRVLGASKPSDQLHPLPRLAKARSLVRRAESQILAQPDRRFRLLDLCDSLEVSERTLQYAFQEILGVSPIHYLNRVRLHQVRLALKQADPQATTVSAEACRWGFWHFGEFTQAYKALFGELPSQTLNAH